MATDPSGDLKLATITGHEQTLDEWLIVFNMLVVVIDPYTYESGWILPTAGRLFGTYDEADIRCAFVVASDAEGARSYLGPFADRHLVLLDEDRSLIGALGLERLPAIVHLSQDATVTGCAEGWNPAEWSEVLAGVEEDMDWYSRPLLPAAGDPGAFEGTPAAG